MGVGVWGGMTRSSPHIYQSLQHQSANSTESRQPEPLLRALSTISVYLFFYFYTTLGYGAMIAQVLNELGKDVKIPKAAFKLLLDVLLAPDLQ